MPTVFSNTANDIITTLTSAYTAGSGTMVVDSTTGMPAPPFRISIGTAIYSVSAINNKNLTVTRLSEGSADNSLPSGSTVEMNFTSGHYAEHSQAINALENQPVVTVGGSNGQLQYNNSGAFAGKSSLTTTNSNPLVLTYTTNDFTNTSGNNAHLVLSNASSTGQSSLMNIINGNVVSKWRTDYVGGVSWIAFNNHAFYVNGDANVVNSLIPLSISSSGVVSVGCDPNKVSSDYYSITPFVINYSNKDYTNNGGLNSHLTMTNPATYGQNVVCSIINNNIVAKWRTDYVGNISWVAGTNGGHDFYVGGDYPNGRSVLNISNNGNIQALLTSSSSFIINAASNQSSDMQQNKDSTGKVVSGVNAQGYIRSVVGSGNPSGSPPSGSFYLDDTNGNLWFMCGTTWKKVTLS